MTSRLLEICNLSIDINGRRIVQDLNLRIEQGETLALVGESGSGKSMTALALIGLLPEGGQCSQGEIHLGNTELTNSTEEIWRKVRGRKIGMIFQDPSAALDPLMTVGGQISEALSLRSIKGRRALRDAARDLLSNVGIPDPNNRLDQYPYELSGGMSQRVMIAVALAAKPDLLIADEPTTALDVTIQAQILDLMQDLQDESGAAILLITHDMGVVSESSDRIAVMYAGTVVETGITKKVLSAPAHPYTQALLRSIPTLDAKRGTMLEVIKGNVPEPGFWPMGCRFAPRCRHAQAGCNAEVPNLKTIHGQHAVACFRLGKIEA